MRERSQLVEARQEQAGLTGRFEAVMRDPFVGIGKPEALKHLGPNVWSRRLAGEHRIVYLVRDDRVDFLQARYHS